MDPDLPPLPPLPSLFTSHGLHHSLPKLIPALHISPLEDRPQDPIVARLLAQRQQTPSTFESPASVDEVARDHTGTISGQIQEIFTDAMDWQCGSASEANKRLLSWDGSHSQSESLGPSSSSYLSEQPPKVMGASQSSLMGETTSQTLVMGSETLRDFFQYLIYGTSSQLFPWDNELQLFKMTPQILSLSIEGLSRPSTHLITTRFLNIGSLLRRLEEFVLDTKSRKVKVIETHSVVHCVCVVTAYLRRTTTERLLSSHGLIAESLQYAESEAILEFLGRICYRGMDQSTPYPPLHESQKALLDHVYTHSAHVVHSSPFQSLRAIAAYVLSETSSGWLRQVATAVGMENDDSDERAGKENITPVYDAWPSFVDERSGLFIERGIKSLHLLRSGRPDHPACHTHLFNTKSVKLEWVWTQKGVQNAVTSLASRLEGMKKHILQGQTHTTSSNHTATQDQASIYNPKLSGGPVPSQTPSDASTYAADLSGMAAFDRPPGLYPNDAVMTRAVERVAAMVASFPIALPSVTPTVDRLGQLVIVEPLVAHSRLLSQSLLDVFLNELHLPSHLDILHRFMLFGDPNFVANLRVALCDEQPFPRQLNKPSKADSPTEGGSLGLGLNPKLSPTGEWPPSGFGLSHSLRSVIVEVLGAEARTDKGDLVAQSVVRQEAEWRMGFVVPPAEGDDEKERCDPFASAVPSFCYASFLMGSCQFSALSFLHLQYRPPDALTSFLNPDVLEKYQRMFDFLLEMLRIDSVLRSSFQTAFREKTSPGVQGWKSLAFPLIRQMESFLNGFFGYIFDTAISANWTSFIQQLIDLNRFRSSSQLWRGFSGSADRPSPRDHDVFAVMQSHSDVLDKILTACFLKGRQRTTRLAIQKPLAVILQLALVLQNVGDAGSKELTSRLRELQSEWSVAMHSLTKTLGNRDKHVANSERAMGPLYPGMSPNLAYSEELLLRVDFTRWYSGKQRGGRVSKGEFNI